MAPSNEVNGVNGDHSQGTEQGTNIAKFDPQNYPPFPGDVDPTLELQTISLAKIQANDEDEKARMFEVCKNHGFFYCDFSGTDMAVISKEAEEVADLAERSFALPKEEKTKYPYQPGTIFGYKHKGQTVTDSSNTPDTAEFFNISKDQILNPSILSQHYPSTITSSQPLLSSFVHHAHATGLTLLSSLFTSLNLPPASAPTLHRLSEPAGSQVRLTYGPPRRHPPSPNNPPEIQTPAHTDFGSITILFNWLGGLQLWSRSSRGTDESNVTDPQDGPDGKWLWVKPRPGHAIINLGECSAVFTGGVLCAGRHRVLPAPGPQGKFGRYSIVYFVRPEDEVVIKRFEGDQIPEWKEGEKRGIEGWKVKDWILRQATGLTGTGSGVDKDGKPVGVVAGGGRQLD